jgi:rare lipoprotein A
MKKTLTNKLLTKSLIASLSILAANADETGIASWYGKENKIGSDGKVLQHYTRPALAHKKLPLGTKVMIINLKNNKSTIAVVEDRGPYKKGRIADLNYVAAKNIDMLNDGVVRIKLQKM